jgi:hypothetical protein
MVFPDKGHSTPIGRHKAAILLDSAMVKLLSAFIAIATLCELPAAQAVPLPRPRPDHLQAEPSSAATTPDEAPAPSACRLRLTSDLADAPSLPALSGSGGCTVDDAVRLEAVMLRDKTRVAVTPPAILRCTFAEAIVKWVREDVAPVVRALGSPLRSIDNYAAYDCRGVNRVVGARLSEHGKANALDMRSFKVANGTVLELTDPQLSKDFRLDVRKIACARFATVLGPGSDGYHENHIHVDLAERSNGLRICHWEVREPGEEAEAVPLPTPRPTSAP